MKNTSVNYNKDAEAEEDKQYQQIRSNKKFEGSHLLDQMEKENCWVWFKGSLKEGGAWKGGFTYKKDANPGVLIQSPSYVQCRVPDWRIRTTKPFDMYKGPEIPENSVWKIL